MTASSTHAPTKELVLKLVEKILASPQFADSEPQQRLLRYLVDASLSGAQQHLDEKQVAEEALGLTASDNAVEEVRQEIRHLRSRLYEFEETNPSEPYALHIPRGSCEPVIRRRQTKSPLRRKRRKNSLRPILLLLLAATVAAACLVAGTLWLSAFWEARQGFETLTSIAGEINHFTVDAKARRIAFSGSIKPGGMSQIFLLDSSGGQPKRFTSSNSIELYPAWSINGNSIAFFRGLDDRSFQFIVRDVNSGLERVIATSPLPSRPAWSPAGIAIYVPLPADDSPTLAIHRVELNSQRPKRISEPDPRSFGDRSPVISPDGKWLAWFRDAKPDGEIWMSALDGSEPRRLVREVTSFRGIDWTPDSRYLIGSFTVNWRSSLWRVERLSGDLVATDVGHPDVWYPSYAHLDRKLVFLDAPVQTRLYDIDLVRSSFRPVNLALPGLLGASLSPDRKKLALFAPTPDAPHYWIAASTGEGSRPLTALNVKGMGAPAWDSESKVMVAPIRDGDGYHLHSILATGGDPRRLFTGTAQELDPVFSPDGTTLYFLSDRSGQWNVWKSVWPVDGDPVQVTETGVRQFHLAPDGKTLALIHSLSSGLWRWDPLLKREYLLHGNVDFPMRTPLLAWHDTELFFLDPYGKGSCCSLEALEAQAQGRRTLFHFDSLQFLPEPFLATAPPGSRFPLVVQQQQSASLRRVNLEIKE